MQEFRGECTGFEEIIISRADSDRALHSMMDAIQGDMAEEGYVETKRKKLGRNDPCPCGSGKKFKKCHINRPEELQALLQERLNE